MSAADSPATRESGAAGDCGPATDAALLVVDKEHPLPDGYEPEELVPIPVEWLMPGFGRTGEMEPAALNALLSMLAAASDDGHELRVRSAFRSYEEQARTFQYWVGLLGETQAQRESARAGYSEHQLGTTVDVSSAAVSWELVPAFGETAEGRWLEEHAARYGFAMSYPRHAEAVTGYAYEPWHLRFIGRICAREWLRSGVTVVEFLTTVRDESSLP